MTQRRYESLCVVSAAPLYGVRGLNITVCQRHVELRWLTICRITWRSAFEIMRGAGASPLSVGGRGADVTDAPAVLPNIALQIPAASPTKTTGSSKRDRLERTLPP